MAGRNAEHQSRAVILARVSSKAQEDEGYSLDSQLKLLNGYCENKGLQVVRVFKIAETASKEQSRKIFHEMLEYITKHKVYHLAVEKTDRFTRNFRDAVAIDDWLEQDEDRRLHAVKENILLHKNAKSDVKFMWNIHLSVAKKYTDNLREEAMKGWAEKLAQGWLPASPPPGYVTVTSGGKRIHVPDPETKAIMQGVFKLYLEPGQTTFTVAKQMRLAGITTRKGRPYCKSKVHKILTNPFYIGINRFNGEDYPGAQEPIVSKKLFDDVQYKIHHGRPRVYGKHNSPLKGMIRCEDCGSVVTWQRQKDTYYGVCRRLTDACKAQRSMLRQPDVEDMVKRKLQELICPSSEVVAWVIDTVRSRQQERAAAREKQVQSFKSQVERLNRMDDMLYEDRLAGEITPERYKAKHEQFMTEKKALEAQLENVGETFSALVDQRLLILELSQKAAQLYDQKSPEQKRLIISSMFEKMTLKDGIVSVTYTKFAQLIIKKVEATMRLMEEEK